MHARVRSIECTGLHPTSKTHQFLVVQIKMVCRGRLGSDRPAAWPARMRSEQRNDRNHQKQH